MLGQRRRRSANIEPLLVKDDAIGQLCQSNNIAHQKQNDSI